MSKSQRQYEREWTVRKQDQNPHGKVKSFKQLSNETKKGWMMAITWKILAKNNCFHPKKKRQFSGCLFFYSIKLISAFFYNFVIFMINNCSLI